MTPAGLGASPMRGVAIFASALLFACALFAPPELPPPSRQPVEGQSELASRLAELAEEALARGELDAAAERYERIRRFDGRSALAHTGLGRVALARGDLEAAQRHFSTALIHDPDAADAHLGLSTIAERRGMAVEARRRLQRVLSRERSRVEAHARLAALTGPAPRPERATPEQVIELVELHPYDPWALLQGARVLEQRADRENAIAAFEKVLWLGDLDPAVVAEAAEALRALDPAWAQRRTVFVHAYADEGVRAEPGWRFRLRTLLFTASKVLAPVLDTHFVPASIGAFRSEGAPADLESLMSAFVQTAGPVPRAGILAGFTRRAPPPRWRQVKRGLAEFAGRRLLVRLEPGALESRVLYHELLHLYGGVHVLPERESLMNPAGDTLKLDPANARIVRALRERAFGPGGYEADVLARVDLDETIAAYENALRLNLGIRQLGFEEARERGRVSRFQGAARWEQASQLDPHLADVALRLASLLLRAERRVEALFQLEIASQLYGPHTTRGRVIGERAEALREALLSPSN